MQTQTSLPYRVLERALLGASQVAKEVDAWADRQRRKLNPTSSQEMESQLRREELSRMEAEGGAAKNSRKGEAQ